MTPEIYKLLSFTGSVALMTLTPGVATALVLQAATRKGRLAAFATTLGVVGALGVWGLVASLGLGAVLEHFPQTLLWVRRIGICYLVYLGVRIFYASFTPKKTSEKEADFKDRSFFKIAFSGFLLMMLTPEIGVFDTTFFPMFLTDRENFLSMGLVFTFIEMLLAFLWQSFLGFAASHWRIWNNPRVLCWLDRIFGIVLLFLAWTSWK